MGSPWKAERFGRRLYQAHCTHDVHVPVSLPNPSRTCDPRGLTNLPFKILFRGVKHWNRDLFALWLLTRFRLHSGGAKPCQNLSRLTRRSRRGSKKSSVCCHFWKPRAFRSIRC